MYLNTAFSPLNLQFPLFEQEGAGSGGGDKTNTGDDTGVGTGDQTSTGKAEDQNNGDKSGETSDNGTVLDGGTADSDDNSGESKDDGKPSDDKNSDDKDGNGESEGAPESYDFSTVMPEGIDVDTGLVDAMSPAMKDLNLTQDQANTLVKAYLDGQTKQAEAQAEAVSNMITGWVDTAKADKEIGHANWDDSVRFANAFIKKFGTPEFVDDVLKGQGMGNHPEMIRIFARAGKAVADDIAPSGEGTDTSTPKDQASAWYGETTPNSKKG